MPREFDFESRLVPLLLAFAKSRNVDVSDVIAPFALSPTVLEANPGKDLVTTSVRVPVALVDALSERLNDPHIGLTFLDFVPRGAYGVAEFLVRSSVLARTAFQSVVRFNAVVAPNQTFTFEESGVEARLENVCTIHPKALGRHLNEYTTAIHVRTMRSLAPSVPVERVWFVHERAGDPARLAAVFGNVPIEFDQPRNGFAVSHNSLELELPKGDGALHSYLEEHALTALASRPQSDDLVERLRTYLREALKSGEPSIERLSARLNLSGRTLQRRLADVKTSFQEVLDDVRFDLARSYLRDARLDITQVAFLLGYSELRAFDRAFRRWANMNPTEWRSQQRTA